MTLPPLSSLRCVQALLKLGYVVRKQAAGQVVLERPGRIVVVPMGRVLEGAALKLVLAAAMVTEDDVAGVLGSTSGIRPIAMPTSEETTPAEVVPSRRRASTE